MLHKRPAEGHKGLLTTAPCKIPADEDTNRPERITSETELQVQRLANKRSRPKMTTGINASIM
jgi:hypothetical protein